MYIPARSPECRRLPEPLEQLRTDCWFNWRFSLIWRRCGSQRNQPCEDLGQELDQLLTVQRVNIYRVHHHSRHSVLIEYVFSKQRDIVELAPTPPPTKREYPNRSVPVRRCRGHRLSSVPVESRETEP